METGILSNAQDHTDFTRTGGPEGVKLGITANNSSKKIRASKRAKLMSNIDGHLATAIEEMLRFSSPVPFFKRIAIVNTTIRGQQIKAGEPVVMFYGSANRDEDVFENPNTFDITRNPNPHVTFGGFGPHQCLGESVARVELAVMFKELLTLTPNISPNGEFERANTNLFAAIARMPVKY